jgi:hypothetical protein
MLHILYHSLNIYPNSTNSLTHKVYSHITSILPHHTLGHEPELVTPLPAQHTATVLGEVGVLLDGHAVPDLVLHAVDEHEEGQQRLERGAERGDAREEGDVQRKAVGEEGLRCTYSFWPLLMNDCANHLCRNHHKLHAIDRPPVLKEEQIGLVGLVRKHANVHVLGEDRRAHERDGGAAGGVEVRPAHAIDPEERRP